MKKATFIKAVEAVNYYLANGIYQGLEEYDIKPSFELPFIINETANMFSNSYNEYCELSTKLEKHFGLA